MTDVSGASALHAYLRELEATPVSISSVTEPEEAWNVHVLDSLEGLRLPAIVEAKRIADIGSGGGFPGAPLAVALPEAEVDLVESVRRKCDFMRTALDSAGIGNASVVNRRAEEWSRDRGRERYDVVTARALGKLAELAELASPLLRKGGSLVAWKGARESDEESELERASEALAMTLLDVLPCRPYEGSGLRHLYLVEKSGPTPERLPRRPGMARKRPFRG